MTHREQPISNIYMEVAMETTHTATWDSEDNPCKAIKFVATHIEKFLKCVFGPNRRTWEKKFMVRNFSKCVILLLLM